MRMTRTAAGVASSGPLWKRMRTLEGFKVPLRCAAVKAKNSPCCRVFENATEYVVFMKTPQAHQS